jgi:hypothetical protein
MPRLTLTDQFWPKKKAIFLKDIVYNKLEHIQTMEDILYRLSLECWFIKYHL